MASTSPNSDKRVDGKSEHGKDDEGADQRDRNRQQRDQRGPPALQEDEDHENDQDQRFDQGLVDFVDAGADGQRGVERDDVVQSLGKPALRFLHHLEDVGAGLQRIAAGSEVKRDERRRLGWLSRLAFFRRRSQPRHIRIVLRSHFHPRHVLQAQDGAVGLGADDDLVELLRRRQASRGAHVVGELLPLRNGLAADLAGGIDLVLRLDGVGDVGHRDAQAGQPVRIHPNAHGIRPGAEDLHLSNAGDARQRVLQIDGGVVGQEDVVVGAVGQSTGRAA